MHLLRESRALFPDERVPHPHPEDSLQGERSPRLLRLGKCSAGD